MGVIMLLAGQVPGSRFGETPDVIAMLRSRFAPDDGGQDGGSGGGEGGSGGSGEGSGAGGQTGSDGKPFDAVRAQRTIDTLRDAERAGKAAAKERDELAAKLKEFEDKGKSEAERLAGEVKSTSEKLTAAEQKARNLAVRAAIAETAGDVGISGAASIKAAMRLLDPSALKFDDEGAVTNADEALKALVKEYPMLAVQGGSDGKAKSIGGTKEPTGGDQSDAALVKARAEEQRKSGGFLGF